jgi:hypothetical protein
MSGTSSAPDAIFLPVISSNINFSIEFAGNIMISPKFRGPQRFDKAGWYSHGIPGSKSSIRIWGFLTAVRAHISDKPYLIRLQTRYQNSENGS